MSLNSFYWPIAAGTRYVIPLGEGFISGVLGEDQGFYWALCFCAPRKEISENF